jgi:LysM repeat protein
VSGKVTAPAVTPAAPSRKRAQSTTATKSYKVQSGDGLIALAKQFGISTQALADLNGIGSTDSLYVGQTLKIPADANMTSSSNSSASRSSSSAVTSNYKVKSGETLIGIANSLGVSAAQVAAVNSSFDERARLQRGQTIKVPVSASQVDNKLNDKPISYKIRSGDTLIGVANRYKIGVSDLAAANNLSTNSNLILGRSLTIPAAGNRSTATSATSTSSAASTSTTSTGKKLDNTENYKVQSGDGLIALARRFGVSVSDLAATNNLSTKAQLQRGQTLKVPKMTVSYQVASGDSLIGLARKYGVSTKELADMNDIAPDTMLQRGQRLTVPNR